MPGAKKHDDEGHENHEAWVIPYADMLTLLMVMFLALYAMGNLDLAKAKKLANAFNKEINGGPTAADPGVLSESPSGGASVLDGSGSWPVAKIVGDLTNRGERVEGAQARNQIDAYATARQAERDRFDTLATALQTEANAAGFGDNVAFSTDARGLHITLVTDQVLFESGSATIASAGTALLDEVSTLVASVGNQVEIVGHTDNVPTGRATFSNWELSTYRAGSVVRYLIEHGIAAERLRASGMADHLPIASNDTAEGRSRNRRVEVIVLSDLDPSSLLSEAATSGARTTG